MEVVVVRKSFQMQDWRWELMQVLGQHHRLCCCEVVMQQREAVFQDPEEQAQEDKTFFSVVSILMSQYVKICGFHITCIEYSVDISGDD